MFGDRVRRVYTRVSRLVLHHVVDAAGLEPLLARRDDVVEETESVRDGGTIVFGSAHGPFSDYSRTVEVGEVATTSSAAGPVQQWQVTETYDYHLDIPYFGVVFRLPVRRAFRTHRHATRQPWWSPPDRMDRRAAGVLGTLAAAAVLTGFLGTLFGQTLTFAADEFDISRTSQGFASAAVRFAPLFAIALVAIADRRGRRRIAVLATFGGSTAAAAGALAPDLITFVIAQTASRTFSAALGTVILVYIIEEMPKGARAYSLSLAGMASALGAGMVLWFLPLADLGPRGWRIVYLVPILAIPLGLDLARRLPESKRYGVGSERSSLRPHLRPMILLGLITFLIAFYLSPADQFRNEYLRDERGFSALSVSLFVISTATPGGIGLLIAGRLADVVGRKVVLTVATTVGLGALTLVFNASGVLMWVLALAAATLSSGLLPALGVYRGELFPNRVRNRAVGWVSVAGVGGSVAGVVLTGWLSDRWSSIGPVIGLLWIAPLLALVIAWFALPETSRRDLVELNPVDGPSPL